MTLNLVSTPNKVGIMTESAENALYIWLDSNGNTRREINSRTVPTFPPAFKAGKALENALDSLRPIMADYIKASEPSERSRLFWTLKGILKGDPK